MISLLRKASAQVPIVLSLAVLPAFLVTIAFFGSPTRQPDEGAAAHLFQIWLVLEFLLIASFAIRWLPQKPKQALTVLVIQIPAVIAACVPVFIFKL